MFAESSLSNDSCVRANRSEHSVISFAESVFDWRNNEISSSVTFSGIESRRNAGNFSVFGRLTGVTGGSSSSLSLGFRFRSILIRFLT